MFMRVALRYLGAGDIISVTNLSTSLRAEVTLVNGIFRYLRTRFSIAFTNCFHIGSLLPLVSIEASFAWNAGLEKASAINSSRLVAPYESSSLSLTLSNSACSCLVIGSLEFATT